MYKRNLLYLRVMMLARFFTYSQAYHSSGISPDSPGFELASGEMSGVDICPGFLLAWGRKRPNAFEMERNEGKFRCGQLATRS